MTVAVRAEALTDEEVVGRVLGGETALFEVLMRRHNTAADPSPEHRAFSFELRALLENAIDTLAPGYREVFMLREVEGMSTAEVAEALGLTGEAVKTRLHRARALLKEDLFSRTGAASAEAFRFHAPRCDRVVKAVMERIT